AASSQLRERAFAINILLSSRDNPSPRLALDGSRAGEALGCGHLVQATIHAASRPHESTGSSGTELSLDLFSVVNGRHVLEAPVDDLIDGVLHHLERLPRGLHADKLLRGSTRVDQLGSYAITVDNEVRQLPVQVRHRARF